MPNFSKDTLIRVGRLMSTGEESDPPPLRKLANSGAFGRKAIYNWSLPESDPQYRKMPAAAKRMVAMLAYFSAAGLLTDKRMEEIISLETTFENETESHTLLRRLKRVMGAGRGGKPGAKAKQPGVRGGRRGQRGRQGRRIVSRARRRL